MHGMCFYHKVTNTNRRTFLRVFPMRFKDGGGIMLNPNHLSQIFPVRSTYRGCKISLNKSDCGHLGLPDNPKTGTLHKTYERVNGVGVIRISVK